jgi:hypothetical protein
MKPGFDRRAGMAVAVLFVAHSFVPSAHADQVITDDLIVDGSLCAGVSCANGEVFNTGVFRVKNNVVRLDLIDTGPAGGSIRDWRIEANAHIGPAGYLAFSDMGNSSSGAEGGTPIMVLTAGAPASSIFVDSFGRVGLGTTTPTQHLSIVDGGTAGIELFRDGSGGLTPERYRIAVNSTGMFFQDMDAGTPLTIENGAQDSQVVLRETGRTGMGTGSPSATLEVRSTAASIGAGNAVLKLVNPAGPTALQMQPFGTGFFWNFAASDNDTFNVNRSGNSAVEMSLNGAGNLTISGTLTTGGPTCATGCDAVFDAGYALPSIEDHAEAMWEKKHLPNVGPTIPHRPVNLSEQYGRLLNELETAHIYVEQLHLRNIELESEIRREREENAARFARLETALGFVRD